MLSFVVVAVSKTLVGILEAPPNILPTFVLIGLLNNEPEPNVAFCPNAVDAELEGVKNIGLVLAVLNVGADELNVPAKVDLVAGNVDIVDAAPNILPELIGAF